MLRFFLISVLLSLCLGDALSPQFVVPLSYGKHESRKVHTVAARQGDSFQINCQLEGKWPKGTKVVWEKDGNTLKPVSSMTMISHQSLGFDKFDEDKHGGIYECLAQSKDVRSAQRIVIRKNISSDVKLPPHVQFCRKQGYCLNGGICLEDSLGQEFCLCSTQYRGERCQVPPLSRIEGFNDATRQEEPKSEVVLGWRDLLIFVLILIIFCLIICFIVAFVPLFFKYSWMIPPHSPHHYCSCASYTENVSRSCVQESTEYHTPCVKRESSTPATSNLKRTYACIPIESGDEGDPESQHNHSYVKRSSCAAYDTCADKVSCKEEGLNNNKGEVPNVKKASKSRLVMQKNIDQDKDTIETEQKNSRLAPGLLHLASADCNYFHSTKQPVQ
ncbi:hypothetical protein QR680_001917 [Steinernema hermaphroditum]|uniref:Ig-like domain-containing protein n=1 Tax=Steinernema hermaphroditum TaxID=289476 RepID=A0AA39H0I6_9BILA|nr:hypothetical protein QR680_001917 [Steinernema hermaphroditum]